ncbi:peptidoglycan editing factor PgeF [Priestia flexa]|jgi:polyphenol oxidase|uniref:Purine nucleoside phosphorylase n=1 Tax=Priestia flexa TaxID=86664 RepID=A0A8I1MC83_9BACI|nr:peptidoglycan editing factor PgeF [Priestia flexa]MBN8250166.1 peptidoglycan editing factor PgeF [Priestia flexa]MBN8433012.1 peptidoglycan editing factor PgeF [Priestia flexa]MCA0965002.1 peptidoglycan editing factor PgeF [Priestia flexa]RIV15692.1 peptidoglycan editing factor PgeF [Priestia flexa]
MNKAAFTKSHHESFMWLRPWMDENSQLLSGFTTKNGGISEPPFTSFNLGLHVHDNKEHVILNRELLANHLNMPLSNWVCAEQVHNSVVQKVTRKQSGKGMHAYEDGIAQTDGIYTNESNVLLALCYADCVPLYFYAPNHHMVGLAHAGWQGTVKDIAGEMIRKWVQEEQIPVEDIYAAVGPAIESCCYIVDDRVISAVNEVASSADVYVQISPNQYRLDLKKLNVYLMKKAGVNEANITVSSHCTSCEDDLFFSHRRDQGKTGRMFSFIGFKED